MKKKESKVQKIALGFALIFLGALLVFGKPHRLIEKSLSTTFASEPVQVQGFDEEKEGQAPQRIVIPSLQINLEVERAEIISGYWEVFTDKAAWGAGSGLPGEGGNQVIFAHAREGLFLPLRQIKQGDKAYVLAENAWYEYEVKEIKEVYPNEVEVIAPTEDETLTLYTCSGFADEKRLIVVAKRI